MFQLKRFISSNLRFLSHKPDFSKTKHQLLSETYLRQAQIYRSHGEGIKDNYLTFEALKKAVKFDPDNDEARKLLSIYEYDQGRLNPKNRAQTLFRQAVEFYKGGIDDNEIAYKILNQAIKLDPTNENIKDKLLEMKYERGEL